MGDFMAGVVAPSEFQENSISNERSMAFRRHKRRRTNQIKPKRPALPLRLEDIVREQDFSFCNYSYEDRLQELKSNRSLPLILIERESDVNRAALTISQWKWQAMARHNNEFRPYASRKIPFQALRTPQTDAVLGLEQTGSYSISLADPDYDERGGNQEDTHAILALRFYGIPSPTVLARGRMCPASVTSPLLRTVPLVFDEDLPTDLFHQSLTSTLPVTIWISSDWRVGVAAVHFYRLASLRVRPCHERIVLFSLSRRVDDVRKTHLLDTFHPVDRTEKYEQIKKFWRVNNVPWQSQGTEPSTTLSPSLVTSMVEIPAYLFLLEFQSTIRLTWFSEISWRLEHTPQWAIRSVAVADGSIVPQTPILRPVSADSWTEYCCDGLTRVPMMGSKCQPADQLKVQFEATLSLESLLIDIVCRRPQLFGGAVTDGSLLPKYVCDIIRVRDQGRTLDVMLCIDSHATKTRYGVSVEVDLFTGTYKEGEWVRRWNSGHCKIQNINHWSRQLSLNRRVRELNLVSTKGYQILTEDRTDMELRGDQELWKTPQEHRQISLNALYPDVDVFTNHSVIFHNVSSSLKSKSAALEVVLDF